MDKLKLAALGERLKTGGAEMGRRVSGKMKEILQVQSQEAKMVDEATSERLEEPNWGLNLRICGFLNSDEFNGTEVMRAIKKKITSKNTVNQRLSLDLLETCALNCDKVFSEVASEKVLDEMVRMIDNPETHYGNRRRAFQLIEAWGSSDDLGYLPVFKQTYISLKGRKIQLSASDEANSSFGRDIRDQSVGFPESYPYSIMDQQNTDPNTVAYHNGGMALEEKKEIVVITRNSIEILSSMWNTDMQHKPSKDELTMSMLEKCKEFQPFIQRIIESTSDDDPLLFEALNLNDELQQVLSKYDEIEAADLPSEAQAVEAPISLGVRPSPEREAGEQVSPTLGDGEAVAEAKNTTKD